jgi:hypothetical protein
MPEDFEQSVNVFHGIKAMIGRDLSVIKNEELWRDSGLDNWYQFLEQPEIDISPQEASKLINNYEFIVKYNLPIDIPQRRLDLLKKSDDPSKLYDDTKLLSIKDMKETMVDINNEKENKPNTRTFNYVIMQKCNETSTLKRVYGVESKEILEKFNINEDGIRHD